MLQAGSALSILRPQNSISPILAFCFGYVGLVYESQNLAGAAQYILIIFLLHSIATLQNDIVDEHIDKDNKRNSVLIDKLLSRNQAWQLFGILCFFLILTIALSDKPLVNIGFSLVFIAGSFVYNMRPFQFSRRPILSIASLAVLLGALPVIYGTLVSDSEKMGGLILLAVSFLLFRGSTAILKDYKDVKGDTLHGKKTFLIAFGSLRTYQSTLVLSSVGGIFLFTYLVIYSPLPAFILGVVGVALGLLVLMRKQLKTADHDHANVRFHTIVKATSLLELGILVCLLLFS